MRWQQKDNVCVCEYVCVCYCLRRAAAERFSLWTGYLDQTSACRFGKHQSKWLCSAVGSPTTARPLQDRLHQPTHAKVSTWDFKNESTQNPPPIAQQKM